MMTHIPRNTMCSFAESQIGRPRIYLNVFWNSLFWEVYWYGF